jgi:hypothetical protein
VVVWGEAWVDFAAYLRRSLEYLKRKRTLWVVVRAMIVEVVLDNEVYEDVYERLDRSKV